MSGPGILPPAYRIVWPKRAVHMSCENSQAHPASLGRAIAGRLCKSYTRGLQPARWRVRLPGGAMQACAWHPNCSVEMFRQ